MATKEDLRKALKIIKEDSMAESIQYIRDDHLYTCGLNDNAIKTMIKKFTPQNDTKLKLLIYDIDDMYFIQHLKNNENYGGIYIIATMGGANLPNSADNDKDIIKEIKTQFAGKKPNRSIAI